MSIVLNYLVLSLLLVLSLRGGELLQLMDEWLAQRQQLVVLVLLIR